MAALDHTHYLRWGLVFFNGIKQLPESVFRAFAQVHFTVKRTDHVFSAMGIDQAHEQNNKVVKIDGGAINILK